MIKTIYHKVSTPFRVMTLSLAVATLALITKEYWSCQLGGFDKFTIAVNNYGERLPETILFTLGTVGIIIELVAFIMRYKTDHQ
jgi:hypothetical protein